MQMLVKIREQVKLFKCVLTLFTSRHNCVKYSMLEYMSYILGRIGKKAPAWSMNSPQKAYSKEVYA